VKSRLWLVVVQSSSVVRVMLMIVLKCGSGMVSVMLVRVVRCSCMVGKHQGRLGRRRDHVEPSVWSRGVVVLWSRGVVVLWRRGVVLLCLEEAA